VEVGSINFVFEEFSFFDAYYGPIRELIARNGVSVNTSDGSLSYIPSLDAYVGLHKDMLDALESRNPNSVRAFADEHEVNWDDDNDDSPINTFADGLLIALGADLKDILYHLQNDPHNENPKSQPKSREGGSMNTSQIGKSERTTQNRVIKLFNDELGYRYLGDWTDRENNSNIEEGLLTDWLKKSGYTPAQISMTLHKLRTEAGHRNRNLYGNNKEVYKLLGS
jgi:hypothetical protein